MFVTINKYILNLTVGCKMRYFTKKNMDKMVFMILRLYLIQILKLCNAESYLNVIK